MKILITGASSLPGYRTALEALKRGHEIIALYYKHPVPIEDRNLKKVAIDITKANDLAKLIFEKKPEVVIHMAALGDVDLCERDKELAWKTTVRLRRIMGDKLFYDEFHSYFDDIFLGLKFWSEGFKVLKFLTFPKI
jgi:dTDP-4-dehydrorhamnose reductase